MANTALKQKTITIFNKKRVTMRKKQILLLFLLTSIFTSAHELRDLLQQKTNQSELEKSLIMNQKWVVYPDYNDRTGWNELTGQYKDDIIKRGEEALDYEWKVVKATDYIEFERSGSREIMQNPFDSNNTALSNLVYAELAEGKGRFIDQIINGVWLSCEMSSWVLSAHLPAHHSSKRTLTDPEEQVIDLAAGDLGSLLSWTWYFLKDEFDKINPVVSTRLLSELQRRILDPYMNRSDFWWQAFNATPETMVNNWNPWCNFNVLTCYLLLENDEEKLAEAVSRTMVSVDKFINYTKSDGACEEGPSYWGHAAGKMYDYLQLLSDATGSKVDIFDQPIIKNMGEYIFKSYIGDGWVVNFADASARGGGNIGLIYRYGDAVSSKEMKKFAAYLYERNNRKPYYNSGRDIYRTLENLKIHKDLLATEPALSQETFVWYPETEFCYMRSETGFFFAAKGGYNAESHNHNDVGSFILYYNQHPVFIDVGVGTYTRQTFSNERYSIWTMQSNYHNLPVINGVPQKNGADYKSGDVKADKSKAHFSLDISKAYPEEAEVDFWKRTYSLSPEGGLSISDNWRLKSNKDLNRVIFMTLPKPDIPVPGKVFLEADEQVIQLSYDSKLFKADVEIIKISDAILSRSWGNTVYRLTLSAKDKQTKGQYHFKIEALKRKKDMETE
jgi:hypothetical protein